MQSLDQEFDSPPLGLTTSDHPVLQGLMADPAIAYAEEVRVLRQRVAVLEAELAATKVAAAQPTRVRQAPPLTTIDFAPVRPVAPRSEFVEQVAPAVSAASDLAASEPVPSQSVSSEPASPQLGEDQSAVAPVTVSDPGFAEAWTSENEDATFEERVAERAFFQASTIDEESRSWLLAK